MVNGEWGFLKVLEHYFILALTIAQWINEKTILLNDPFTIHYSPFTFLSFKFQPLPLFRLIPLPLVVHQPSVYERMSYRCRKAEFL